ncbi:MAG: HD domain-containing protein [Spirochaetia bacterium]|nr:HD domain-containing protein [Spirochaetia bacterium]
MDSLDLKQTPFIDELNPGMLDEGYFLLKKIHINVGKKNKPFLRLLLSDKSGHLPGVYFDSLNNLKKFQTEISEGDVVKVNGLIEEYQDVLQVKIQKMEKTPSDKWELTRFWKRTTHDRRLLLRELQTLLQKIKTPGLKKLCQNYLNDKEFLALFLEAPASRFFHHAYIGGLLEHTLSVVKLVQAYSIIYPLANPDILLTGAFLHDIGKVDEYRYLLKDIEYSTEARLKGHTLLGYERLQPSLNKVNLDENLKLKIEHILISHQGKKEWGALIEPKFLEAYLIHAADSTDSNQFIFSDIRKFTENSRDKIWSKYISILNRELYLG